MPWRRFRKPGSVGVKAPWYPVKEFLKGSFKIKGSSYKVSLIGSFFLGVGVFGVWAFRGLGDFGGLFGV